MTTRELDPLETETLRYLWTPDLDPLFWRPGRIGVGSAWYGHVPFAHWIVGAVKPRTLVELGTHNGVSYSAFCEAVVRSGLDTCCYAVDTWLGDDHARHYGEEVYLDFRRFHDSRYGAFSHLLRCTFDDALCYMLDAGLDLLHIDGFHTYEAVKHDFESWCNKLSDCAVVLFHDTNVRERDFGVWRFWEEIRTKFPSFEFLHGYGVGVLAVGPSIPPQVRALCSVREPACVRAIRERFSLLGERWILEAREQLQEREIAARDSRILSLEAEAARRSSTEAQFRARAAERAAEARAEAARAMGQLADKLHVSDNFSLGDSLCWFASECEEALRRNLSPEAADTFKNSSMEHFISLWRGATKARSTDPVWSALAQLPQAAQESIATGFEHLGRRSAD
jgi:hypothetical protein